MAKGQEEETYRKIILFENFLKEGMNFFSLEKEQVEMLNELLKEMNTEYPTMEELSAPEENERQAMIAPMLDELERYKHQQRVAEEMANLQGSSEENEEGIQEEDNQKGSKEDEKIITEARRNALVIKTFLEMGLPAKIALEYLARVFKEKN